MGLWGCLENPQERLFSNFGAVSLKNCAQNHFLATKKFQGKLSNLGLFSWHGYDMT